MGKYIDADCFRTEIEKTYKSEIQPWLSGVSATSAIYDYVLPIIESLQQEQKSEQYSPLCNTIKDKIREYIANHFVADTVVKTDVKSIVKAMEEGVRLGKESQKPAEWSEDYQEENIQTRFAFYTYKDDPSTLYLSNVFVEEASRNHGFGTRILKAAEKVAEAVGATTISLKVKQDSPANTWYRKRGYGYVAFEDGYDWLEKNLEYMKPNNHAEWSEEDEHYINGLIGLIEDMKVGISPKLRGVAADRCIAFLKSLRPQPREEIYHAAKHDLAIRFMNYLDENRPEGKMSLSNGECEDIDKAFKENDWAKIVRYYEKYRPQLKQEWSEEDERMWKSALWHIKNSCGNGGKNSGEFEVYQWFKNRVKSLRTIKQEWSEEDKKNLKQCIEIVRGWEIDYDYANPHYSNWLKSFYIP